MEITIKKLLLTSILFIFINSAQAVEPMQWNKIAISYESNNLEDINFIGFGFYGTRALNDNFFVSTSYKTISTEIEFLGFNIGLDLNNLSIGIGQHFSISQHTELFSIVSYENREDVSRFDGNTSRNNENGFGFETGFRSLPIKNIELNASYNYISINENRLNISIQAQIVNQFSTTLNLSKAELGNSNSNSIIESDSITLSGVYYF